MFTSSKNSCPYILVILKILMILFKQTKTNFISDITYQTQVYEDCSDADWDEVFANFNMKKKHLHKFLSSPWPTLWSVAIAKKI